MKQFFSICWSLPFLMVIQPPLWACAFTAAAFGFHPETGGISAWMLIISTVVFIILYGAEKGEREGNLWQQHHQDQVPPDQKLRNPEHE